MARKSLINVSEANFYHSGNPVYSMLLSGNMNPVKQRVISAALQKKNMPVVVINLDATSTYMTEVVGNCYDYSITNGGSYDIFSSMSIRDACMYLQNAAYDRGYSDEQTTQIVKYLMFIDNLNRYLGLNHLSTVRMINDHYYSPEVVNQAMTEMFHSGIISIQEYQQLSVSLVRSIKGQLIIDNILTSVDFNLGFDNHSGFAFSSLQRGQMALIDLSVKHNSYTEKRARNDILYSLEECYNPMTIVLNIGSADYSLITDFIQNMTIKSACQLIVIMDDVFAQVNDYDRFRRKFSLNLFGQHTGESCQRMSESCFHKVYKDEIHYSRSVDRRLFADRFIDVLFHTNHTDTTASVPVQRSVFEQHDIANLSPRAFIMLNNTGSSENFSIHNV